MAGRLKELLKFLFRCAGSSKSRGRVEERARIMNREQISQNFHLARVTGIFAVIVAHYAQVTGNSSSSFLWIGAQMGLCIFAFSSGYFTALNYREGFSLGNFWKAKIPRLLGPLLVLDIFLLALFLIRGEDHVVHWQSPLAWFGLTGVLRWFGVPRVTPFGNGLWFLTLLLLFYALYPLIERINRSRTRGFIGVVLMLTLAMIFERVYPLGVTFWETAWFFTLGAFCGRHFETLSWKPAIVIMVGCAGMLPLLRYGLGLSWLSPLLVTGLGMGVVWLAIGAPLPLRGGKMVAVLSGVMLEMYVIHGYLFTLGWTGSWILDLLLSLGLIIGVSLLLHPMGKWLGQSVAHLSPGVVKT